MDVEVVTILTTYLYLTYGGPFAGGFALAQGILTDIFSGGLKGLHTFAYLAAVGAISLGSGFLDLYEIKGQVLIVGAAVFFQKALTMVMLMLWGYTIVADLPRGLSVLVSIAGTGALTPLFFMMFKKMSVFMEEETTNPSRSDVTAG